jgi:A/G-specific adenine glycosylase
MERKGDAKDKGGAVDRPAVKERLVGWYLENRRALPWRETRDPYRIWVSEIMLQQTRVNTVIAYYRRFISSFPDIGRLAEADLEAVLKLWEGLGYYSRARNFHAAARIVAANGGAVPRDWAAFRSLPGVGDYIASAVLSIAFGRPYPVVDGNVKRVLSRLFEIPAPVNRAGSGRTFQDACRRIFDEKAPGTFNQALMELGALVCSPAAPSCGACPLAFACRARAAGTVSVYPVREPRRPAPEYHMAIGVVAKGRRLLIVRRPVEQMLGGLWEFPGGPVREGEAADAACLRNVREIAGLSVALDFRLTRIRHAYTHFKIVADVFICRYRGGRVRRSGPEAHRWAAGRTLEKLPFPGSHHKFFPLLLDWYAALPRDCT